MSSNEFRALLSRDRPKAIRECVEALIDANYESRQDLINSFTSLAMFKGAPRLVLGEDDDDICNTYDELVDNWDEEWEE